MDKYEYKLKLDQMKSLVAEHDYENAVQIADSINWRKIKNVNALVKAGEIYEKAGRYEDSKEVLLMAYDRSPIGRTIIYQLAEVAIKTGNFEDAKEYYNEFVEIAPHDNLKYVLKYEIHKAQGADASVLIGILEDLKNQEYLEEWAFELAHLYHQAGMSDKCIEACDELILWFGDGDYVEQALELKMLYQPLTKQQEEKYRKFRQRKEGVIEVRPEDELESGEIVREPIKIRDVKMSPERFNTQNLQEELQKSMQQIMDATEKATVADSMDNIKKLVEDIPFLQIPHDKELEEALHIETDAEIDDSLRLNFQEMLDEDYDGQMSLYMPERKMIESQITGQMSIEDVLAEWEKTKHAAEVALQEAEQRKLESAKARALQEAGDIMERLADVIPKLDSGLTPKEILEEQYLNGEPMEDEEAAAMMANMNQILQEEIDRLSEENDQMDEQLAAVEAAKVGRYAQRVQEAASMEETAEELAPEVEQERAEVKELVPDSAMEEALEAEELELEDFEVEDFELEDLEIEEPEAEPVKPISNTQDLTNMLVGVLDDVIEEDKAEAKEKAEAKQDAELPKIDIPKEEKVKLPEVEPVDIAEEPGALTKLTKEYKEIFSYFVPIKGMEQQLCQAMTGVIWHLAHPDVVSRGHLLIVGGSGSGKTVLATSMVKALQKETGKLSGKIGRIEAAVLNKKDVAVLLKKVAGGCLIVEKAGELSRETAIKMSLLLESDQSGLLVILEDTKKGIESALSKDEGFAMKFSEKISIPIFTSDELVNFAKVYANELGYTIDDMGILALYNSISSIQKIDRETTLAEVKVLVDDAIAYAEKGSIRKAFSILMARRYDENDYVILHEKDFNI